MFFSPNFIVSVILYLFPLTSMGFLGDTSGRESACQGRKCRRLGFHPWVGMRPWRRKWLPTPEFLSRESHGQRSLASYSPWGHKESDMSEHVFTALHLPSTYGSDFPAYFMTGNFVFFILIFRISLIWLLGFDVCYELNCMPSSQKFIYWSPNLGT